MSKQRQLVEAVNAYAKRRGYQLTPFGEQVVRAEVEIVRLDARDEMERLIRAATVIAFAEGE